AEHAQYPSIADPIGELVYARLQKGDDKSPTAYRAKELDAWARRAKEWARGGSPDELPLVDPRYEPKGKPRDVFVYFIHEGKVRAPAAAMAMIERLGKSRRNPRAIPFA